MGATPSFIELPRNHCDRMRAFKDADAPLSPCPPELDPKWRFFWRISDLPEVRVRLCESRSHSISFTGTQGIPRCKSVQYRGMRVLFVPGLMESLRSWCMPACVLSCVLDYGMWSRKLNADAHPVWLWPLCRAPSTRS